MAVCGGLVGCEAMLVDDAPRHQRGCCLQCLTATVLVLGAVYYVDTRHILSNDAFRAKYGDAAFIAGASEGLGAAWAEYLAARGVNLFIVARHEKQLETTATRLRNAYGVSIDTLVLDLSNPEVVQTARNIFDQRSDIRMLVYNAAYTGYAKGYFSEDTLEMAHKAVDVNIKGVLSLVHPFLRQREARNQSGGVVLMSSMAGLVGSAHLSVYASTKAWNTAFATGLYDELRDRHVDVLSCIAGATTTPNYLKDALNSRSTFIEQPPADVVDECAGALGHVPSRATGLVNRFAQALMTRLLPTSVAVHILSEGALSTTKFESVGPWAQHTH